ncbi:MAG: hypothetical protein QE283_12065 [Rhodoferax sp.]|nr:hypothetical protein [Rhodoferax sp.]
MNIQSVTVAVVVACSFAYAAWTLAPHALRSALAQGLLRLPLPAWASARLTAPSAAGCGSCNACSQAPSAANNAVPAAVRSMVFYPRKPQGRSAEHKTSCFH